MKERLDGLKYNDQGLIPAIVQDRLTGEVRMMAWMNRESLEATLRSRMATFYSRSRKSLWIKGEQSGNVLAVTSVYADCDGDTLLVQCDPAGPSCHTGADNCFFVPLQDEPGEPLLPLAQRLEAVLESRKTSTGDKSYTKSLFEGGSERIGGKIEEEASELRQALEGETDERVDSEAADLLFHVLVGLRFRGRTLRDALSVLAARFGVGGHGEKAARR